MKQILDDAELAGELKVPRPARRTPLVSDGRSGAALGTQRPPAEPLSSVARR
jgi:hypothetical protein